MLTTTTTTHQTFQYTTANKKYYFENLYYFNYVFSNLSSFYRREASALVALEV